MQTKQAADVWRELRRRKIDARAVGIPGSRESAVEIPPNRMAPLDMDALAGILELAGSRGHDLSFGTSPRAVLVIS